MLVSPEYQFIQYEKEKRKPEKIVKQFEKKTKQYQNEVNNATKVEVSFIDNIITLITIKVI